MRRAAAFGTLGIVVLATLPVLGGDAAPWNTKEFNSYWFQGQAELNRYELEQARYGETHQGEAVLIFVTEDFLPDEQVKSDGLDRERSGAWPVLKLNLTKKFSTGLYPYSMMTSIFTPLDVTAHPRTLKTSTSVQEWCGHTWLQLNYREDSYRVRGYSYFESEGEVDYSLDGVWLEDELWTRIRLAPSTLPSGSIEIVPGSQQARLRHRPLRVETAEATRVRGDDGTVVYTLSYPATERVLSIRFQEAFPHEIVGWEERYRSGFGPGSRMLTTRASRTHLLREAYWTRNRDADRELRGKLGLDP